MAAVLIMLASIVFPAVGSATVNACIEACAAGMMPADAACVEAPESGARVSSSGDCCHHAEPAEAECVASPEHSDGSCDCATCGLAPSRFFVKQASVKLPPMSYAAVISYSIALPTRAPVLDTPGRFIHERLGLSRAQLCVYLC